jgi:ribosomal-protein-alanine N-acetyltransferase
MRIQIDTSRLTLRPMQKTDLSRLVCLANDLRVSANLSRMPHPYREQDGEEWLRKQPELWAGKADYVFAIDHKVDGFMGSIGLHWMDRMTLDDSFAWELGYWLGVPYWGQGFATEAGKGLIEAAIHDLDPAHLVAGFATTNTQSGHVLEKLGFYKVDAIRELSVVATGKSSPTQVMRRDVLEAERRLRS